MPRPIIAGPTAPNPDRLQDINNIRKQTNTTDSVASTLQGIANSQSDGDRSWNDIVAAQIEEMTKRYVGEDRVTTILSNWHKMVTLDYKYNQGFSPHINGFYMIFMVHGTWYDMYTTYVNGENQVGLSAMPDAKKFSGKAETQMQNLGFNNPYGYINLLATDIDVPDMTEEYISVSSRLRNSFVPARNYFVSDFNISYVENANLDIMRYHDAWLKFLELIKRGEHDIQGAMASQCEKDNAGYFLDMPFSNAVWVAVFKPFTTDIQMIIKLMGVMPVSFPIKQIIGNRSQSKLTVLNIPYKAADVMYKFYNSTKEFLDDNGALAQSFRDEVLFASASNANKTNTENYFGRNYGKNQWSGI